MTAFWIAFCHTEYQLSDNQILRSHAVNPAAPVMA
jgi:hypothetical protein